MSAINPSTYMAMNPNTGPRPPQFQKPGHSNHAANYLRAQEDYRSAIESGRNASPIDRDGPAARGNREFERVMQMQNSARHSMGPGEASSALPGPSASDGEIDLTTCSLLIHMLIDGDFPSGMQSHFDPRRTPNTGFAPNGQFAAFANQYRPAAGPMAGHWPQNGGQGQFAFYPSTRDAGPNYSISPAMPQPSSMNQQAAAFTPRAQQKFSGYPTPIESDSQKLFNEQFHRLTVDPTRRA